MAYSQSQSDLPDLKLSIIDHSSFLDYTATYGKTYTSTTEWEMRA